MKKILCFGDSLTAGFVRNEPDHPYTIKLSEKLEQGGYKCKVWKRGDRRKSILRKKTFDHKHYKQKELMLKRNKKGIEEKKEYNRGSIYHYFKKK